MVPQGGTANRKIYRRFVKNRKGKNGRDLSINLLTKT